METRTPQDSDPIADSLGLTPVEENKPALPTVEPPDNEKSERDFEYARENLYHLIERGRDALDGILDLASQSQHPRAFEVAGQLIKTISDTNSDLIKLHKSAKEVLSDPDTGPDKVTNNLFVGSTADLTRLLGGNARDILRKK